MRCGVAEYRDLNRCPVARHVRLHVGDGVRRSGRNGTVAGDVERADARGPRLAGPRVAQFSSIRACERLRGRSTREPCASVQHAICTCCAACALCVDLAKSASRPSTDHHRSGGTCGRCSGPSSRTLRCRPAKCPSPTRRCGTSAQNNSCSTRSPTLQGSAGNAPSARKVTPSADMVVHTSPLPMSWISMCQSSPPRCVWTRR
jgi:hypothetical protein